MSLNNSPRLTIGESTFQDKANLNKLAELHPLRGRTDEVLETLGQDGLASRMSDDMGSRAALEFASKLRDTVKRLEQYFQQEDWNFDKALAEIRVAADWYERVGKLGCDVIAGSDE